MPSPQIQYEDNVPGEISAALAVHLERWLHLVPTWCHHLRFRYEPDDKDNHCTTRVWMEYRQARISLCASWLTLTPEARDRALAHELLHVLLEPLQNVDADLLTVVKDKMPDAHTWATEARRHATESVISDLLHLVRAPAAWPE